MTTRNAERPRFNFTQIEHERNLRGDRAFKAAMLRARQFGRENFSVGVDLRPGTEHPIFVRHHASDPPRVSTIDGV